MIAYTVVMSWAAWVASRPASAPPVVPEALPFISILVAARNEEAALPRCLAALCAQQYPAGQLEILVADDQSTDGTAALVQAWMQQDPRIRYLAVPPSPGPLRGKAHALHTAIGQAKGNLLLITDADCAPQPTWARNLAGHFTDPGVGMVCGITVVAYRTWRDAVQTLDWMYLMTPAAAMVRWGYPITAMGNNMGVRREAYEAVGGYPALPFSVTEDYILFQAINQHPTYRVHLPHDAGLRNDTLPLPSLVDAFRQRKRWARGGLHAPPGVLVLSALAVLLHLMLIGGLFLYPMVVLGLWGIKGGLDALTTVLALRKFGVRYPWHAFLPFQLYLYGYLVLMPLVLAFAPRIIWKQRTY